MPTYTTVLAKNLRTGEPIVFEVSQIDLDGFEKLKQAVKTGKCYFLSSEQDAVSYFEFRLFPAFHKVVKIFIENGFTDELFAQILREFGIEDRTFIQKLLDDAGYIASIRPFFTGIACQGDRASRTLAMVYEATRRLYTEKINNLPLHPDLL